MKEGAGNKGKPLNKDHFMWGQSKTQSTWHESYTGATCQNYLQPHKIVSSTTKHLKLTVLKQKQIVRKQQLQQHKDVQALFYRYAATGDHNKPHNLNTVDEITFTLPTERTNITLDLCLKRRITHQEEHKQNKQQHTQKTKTERQEIKRK